MHVDRKKIHLPEEKRRVSEKEIEKKENLR